MAGDFRERAQQIHRLVLRDAETGLPNRLGLEQALAEAQTRQSQELVVVAIRLPDGAGLKDAAEGFARQGAVIGRLGVDCLAMVFFAKPEDARAALSAALAGGAERYTAGAVAASSAHEPFALLDAAELALSRTHADAPVLVFDIAALRDGGDEEKALLSDLAASLAAGELSLLHQPKRRLADGVIIGVESLIRWRHAHRGTVSPDIFVPIAEAYGHIAALTEWTLAQAVADQQSLRGRGVDLPFSINVSAALLADPTFADRTIAAARGARLCFEITETAVMAEPEIAREIVANFREAGIAIAIDDYGARLSSLSYLMQIPADELKIDKRFVGPLAQSAYDRRLVASMIGLAHDLGLTATAEGVETGAVADVLRALGCDVVQGNLIAPPLDLEQLGAYLAGA